MIRRSLLLVCCAASCLVVSSCQRLEDARPLAINSRGGLPIEHSKYADAIPVEYGDLIGVTSNATYPAWSQAWFMRPDKSIVIVSINSSTGKILDRVVVIARR
jgi:CelD/BcsL family acetyltransferase involved in cellulose biosynthesis